MSGSKLAAAPPLALSLSGSGHLLVYQLGACRSLLSPPRLTTPRRRIRHIAGSSGGAIAATVVAVAASRKPQSSSTSTADVIQDFATRFIRQRGGGLTLLEEFLSEQQALLSHSSTRGRSDDNSSGETPLLLHIATTRCRDVQGRIFSFDCSSSQLLGDQKERLLRCVEASCRFPSLFHPYDILSPPSSYPEHEGVVLGDDNNENEEAYVDGGIAFPAPPIPSVCNRRVIVSPLSGSSRGETGDHRISPNTQQRLFQMTLPDNMGIHLSRSNLRAVLRGATGLATSDELHDWYQCGQQDAEAWWNKMEQEQEQL